jgi:hypothetical protein
MSAPNIVDRAPRRGDAPGAAQPAPVAESSPKGRAWGAGLLILLLLAILGRVAWLLVH